MEIKLNIPQNDYTQPTEVRDWVVQGICDAFLSRCAWSTFHPFTSSAYRKADKYIIKHKNEKNYYGFQDEPCSHNDGVKFNGAEMKAAFAALRNAGYHMFVTYDYGTWKGYFLSKKPFEEGYKEVFEFTDFID